MSAAVALDYHTPQQGERLSLPDGRGFIFTAFDPPHFGQGLWWRAVAADGRSTLQGNARLKRRGLTGGWVLEHQP